jgi:LysM repeat protein/ABC-type branched-subunit amino acid transport system substrate-binding protein
MRKIILIIIILVLSVQGIAFSQNFRTHKVKQGETIEGIAKQYSVTPFDIYALNPDAKKKLNADMVLIIPNTKDGKNENLETRELIGYDTHRVKRKETLYSISKEYNIEIVDIKEHNKELYADNLKKGDKIRIPKFKTVTSKVTVKENTLKKYKVQPKEGKWRIAYKFGLTVPELDALNPNMPDVLQPGDEINVPNLKITDEKTVETNYNYYEVLPKEGFFRLKVKLGLTEDQLEALNPGVKESGLKEGMVLKVPGNIKMDTFEGAIENSNLTKSLKNLKTKRLALLLPFKLDKIDVDSVQETKDILKNDRLLAVTLDYYSGVKMALDSAKQLGISTYLKVFDTQNLSSEVSNILEDNDFSNYDAVMGPILAAQFDRVALHLKRDNVPAISPLMKPTNLYSNVFQTIPSEDYLEQVMIQYVKADSLRSNVVIISDATSRKTSDNIKAQIPGASLVYSKKNKEGKDAYYVNAADLAAVFKSGKNYVFLETSSAALVLNVVSSLNSMNSRDKELILVTTNKTDAFDYEHLSNNHLGNLKFHYPSVSKPFNTDKPNGFIKRYKREYSVDPNKYAVRGFDLTLDVLLRLASDDDMYKASTNDVETQYLENKFRYAKKLSGGFLNESAYILQYTTDLTIEEAKR